MTKFLQLADWCNYRVAIIEIDGIQFRSEAAETPGQVESINKTAEKVCAAVAMLPALPSPFPNRPPFVRREINAR